MERFHGAEEANLESTDPLQSIDAGEVHILGATLRLERGDPAALLRLGEGEPRGFWSRGRRWVAHLGAAAKVEVTGDGTGRIGRVAEHLRGLLESLAGGESAGGARLSPAPRLYGGFAFADDHRPSGFWRAFPPALFVLPELEMVGDERGAELRVWSLVRPGRDEQAREGMETYLRERADAIAGVAHPGPAAPVSAARRETERGAWEEAVEDILGAIRSGEVRKVVLARTLDVATAEPLDPVTVATALQRENPGCHVFLFEPEAGAVLVGATPETVTTLSRGVFRATAVAGSISRGESPEEQEALALRLLESHKDQVEHAIALQDMVARLTPLAEEVQSDSEPHVLTLSRIQHLETRIRASIPPGRSVLDLLAALHPTPAVCGLPRDAALRVLERDEPFHRGWYAGPVGWVDGEGNGVFAPALRSAVHQDGEWRLFAGAGIVAESVPALEWEETRIKFAPVLRALRAAGAVGAA